MKTIACALALAIGRHPNYIVRQLWNMQNGDRDGSSVALMKPVVEKLTNDDMLAIAAYAASLQPEWPLVGHCCCCCRPREGGDP
jgi:cytochrome c553